MLTGIVAMHHALRHVDPGAPATLARPFTSTTPLTGRCARPFAHSAPGPLSKLGRSKSAHSTGASSCLERKAKFSCRDKPSKWIAGNVRTPYIAYAFTHKKLDVIRNIFEDPAVEAPAEQIHEVLNNKKSCMIFESELQRVWPGEKEKR